MIEPRSTATIKALASLAELSADQLEEGVSVEEVIATLRKAAEAVRLVVDQDAQDEAFFEEEPEIEIEAETDAETDLEETDIVQDLTPMDLSEEESDSKIIALDKEQAASEEVKEDDEPVLNAG